MKKLMFALILGISTLANAQDWKFDKSHSSVKFSITHMVVSEVEGNFKDFTSTVSSAKPDFSDLAVDFTIQAKSINTDDEKRDGHLQAEDFFNAEKFPTIEFKSTSLKKVKGNLYEMKGNLTLKGITKAVKFSLKYNGTVKDLYGNTRAGFRAETSILRSDFGLSWNKTLDKGGLALSDVVKISVNTEIFKK